MLEDLRQEIWQLHHELPRSGLVTRTSGNVSGCEAGSDLVVIKPSGIRYEALTPKNMVVVDLDGKVVEGACKPSSDKFAHLYIDRHRPSLVMR